MPESSLIQTSHPSPLCGEDAASCYRHSSVANTRSTAVVSRSFHPHHPLSRSVHPLSRSVHGCVLREAEEGLGCTCWPGGRVERAREEGFDGERERGWIESKIGVWWRGEVKRRALHIHYTLCALLTLLQHGCSCTFCFSLSVHPICEERHGTFRKCFLPSLLLRLVSPARAARARKMQPPGDAW